MKNIGTITQIIGPVVDVEFPPGKLPAIYNAIRIRKEDGEQGTDLITEVAAHLGNNVIRTIAMGATDGLVRGMEAEDTGGPITVPVGRGTLGRIMNVIGEPVDEMGPIKSDIRYSIHRDAPSLEDQSTENEILETGIKVIDLLEPYPKGGKIGLFGGAGVGKTVIIKIGRAHV